MSNEIKNPKRRKNISLPEALKKPYGAEINISDVRLFTGLFYHIKRDENNKEKKIFYELDVFGDSLYPIDPPHYKVYREIDDAILSLLKGKTAIGDENQNQLKSSHYRTICMLLALRHLFRKTKENQEPLIDELHDKSESIEIKIENNCWYLSYPLLLVQAVRFSQWELENQDYCFEFFTAKRARKYLEEQFKKWWAQKVLGEKAKTILNIFTRLIRWHTLEGQFIRKTSEFGIKELSDLGFLDKSKVNDEIKMLYAITYADALTREDSYRYEHEIKRLTHIKNKNIIKGSILNELKSIPIDDKLSATYASIEDFLFNGKKGRTIEKSPKKRIWSYTVPAGITLKDEKEPAEITLSWQKEKNCWDLRNKLKDKTLSKEKDNDNFCHIIVNRRQRTLGVISKIVQTSFKITERSLKQ